MLVLHIIHTLAIWICHISIFFTAILDGFLVSPMNEIYNNDIVLIDTDLYII